MIIKNNGIIIVRTMETGIAEDIIVLLEVEGFRREVHIKNGEDVLVCLERELGRIGKDVRLELSASTDLQGSSDVSTKGICRLQRWSEKWNCFVDITDACQIADGDKLITICPRSQCTSEASMSSFDTSAGKVN